MKAIWENIKLVLQMVLLGGVLLYVGTMLFMPDLTIKIFQFQPYVVMTESMEPYINVNDMVVITQFDIDEAEVGDIITFYADIDYNGTQEVVTHFIYSIDTSGDEAIIRTHRYFEEGETVTPDTWLIPESDVLGAYSFHVQYFGYLIGFVKSIYGIAIIALNIIIFSAIKFINKRSAQKELDQQVQETKPQTNVTTEIVSNLE
jgi:signal peptidase